MLWLNQRTTTQKIGVSRTETSGFPHAPVIPTETFPNLGEVRWTWPPSPSPHTPPPRIEMQRPHMFEFEHE